MRLGRRRWILNIALLALAAVLAAFAFHRPHEPPPPAQPTLLVSTLDPSTVHRFTLDGPAGRLTLRRGVHGDWFFASVPGLTASRARVRAVLALTNARAGTTFRALGNRLSDFGLDPPRARLRIGHHDYAIGATEPVDGLRYVLYGGEVNLISYPGYAFTARGLPGLVARTLLPHGARIVRLALPGHTLHEDRGFWHLEPASPRAGADDLVAWIQAWQRAEALEVTRWSPGTRSEQGTPARADIEYTLGDEHYRAVFDILRRNGELVLVRKDAGLAYELPGSMAKRLLERPRLH